MFFIPLYSNMLTFLLIHNYVSHTYILSCVHAKFMHGHMHGVPKGTTL